MYLKEKCELLSEMSEDTFDTIELGVQAELEAWIKDD